MLLYSRLPGAKWWTWLTVVACAAILVSNTVYLDASATPRFFLEKGQWAHQSWWLAAFYFHIVGASVCLAAGTPLMFPAWTRKHRAWHRRLGYVYINAVLWMAAPAGVAMSFVAKGGWWGTTAFALAGILWWYSTWSGYRAIRRGDLPGHIRSMVRSYSWALSAPAFRIIQAALFACGLDDATNYIVSLWLSIAVSVWLAESFLYRGRRGALPFASAPSPPAGVVS